MSLIRTCPVCWFSHACIYLKNGKMYCKILPALGDKWPLQSKDYLSSKYDMMDLQLSASLRVASLWGMLKFVFNPIFVRPFMFSDTFNFFLLRHVFVCPLLMQLNITPQFWTNILFRTSKATVQCHLCFQCECNLLHIQIRLINSHLLLNFVS